LPGLASFVASPIFFFYWSRHDSSRRWEREAEMYFTEELHFSRDSKSQNMNQWSPELVGVREEERRKLEIRKQQEEERGLQ